MTDDKTYLITLKGKGMNLENEEIDALQAAKIFVIVQQNSFENNSDLSTANGDRSQSLKVLDASGILTPSISVREYLIDSEAKTNPQKILIFAMYLKEMAGNESFSIEEVKSLFRKAAEIVPKNFFRDVRASVKNGWITEESRGIYYVTSTGIGVAQSKFKSQQATKPVRIHKKGGKKFLPTVKIRTEIEDLNLEPISEDYGNYWKLNTKSDKIIWISAVAKTKNINELYFKELTEIASKLGDNIPSNSISALIEFPRKNGRIMTSKIGEIKVVKILEPGIQYLKEFKTNTK